MKDLLAAAGASVGAAILLGVALYQWRNQTDIIRRSNEYSPGDATWELLNRVRIRLGAIVLAAFAACFMWTAAYYLSKSVT